MDTHYIETKVRLLVISCIIIVNTLITICMQVIRNDSTSLKHLFFITLCFNIWFLILNILIQFFDHIINLLFKNSYNITATTIDFNFCTTLLAFVINLTIIICLIIVDPESLEVNFRIIDMVTCVPWIFLSWTFMKMVDLNNSNTENSAINSMQGLDYGTAMAYSYYYGYLKLVLPSTGTLNKGLIEKIENIEDKHNITIAVHKLLILIPSSSYIPPDLKDISNRWMESAIDLEAEIRDRAGTKRREYHNNVYKIYSNGDRFSSKPLYVIVEGATPLLTFYEVQKHNHPETKWYRKFHKNIVKNFYDKLKELLDNDPECSELCELIYYDDYDDKNVKVNVAKIICNKISNSEISKLCEIGT